MTTEKGLGHFLTAPPLPYNSWSFWYWKKDSITFLQLLKLLMLKKNYHFLTTLKAFNNKKGHHHCLKVLNTVTFLWLLKFLILKKDSITSLRLLKVLILKNDFITFLWLFKFFKIAILQNAGEQLLLKATYYIIFMINELDLLWVPNFRA